MPGNRTEEILSLQLIISGMHRSGTSLVSSILREAGLDIGVEGSDPGVGQPRGHFEDRDFHRFHEAILAAAGRTCFTADEPIGEVAPVFAEQARALVAARADRPFWGWKDPRTCLFLDFWERLLPQARYLFLYRHPVDVALSLWRRDTEPELRQDPWLAFRSWELYNRRLLALRDRHPGRCFVAHAPAFAADFPGFLQRLAAKLDLPLRGGDFSMLFDPDELAPSCQPPRPAWEELIPEALALYRSLEEIADLPSVEEPPGATVGGRQRSLLQGSEILLYELLEASRSDSLAKRESVRLRLQEQELRRRLEAGEEEAQAVLREIESSRRALVVLRQIESSRGYTVLRAWWWLRRLPASFRTRKTGKTG